LTKKQKILKVSVPKVTKVFSVQTVLLGVQGPGTSNAPSAPIQLWNVVERLFFIFIAGIGTIAMLIRSTMAGARERKNIISIYMKILMNHLQLLLLISNFEFDWPQFVKEAFAVAEPVAEISKQMLSFDCFLDTRTDTKTEQEDSLLRIQYQKMVIFSFMPLLLASASYCFWLVRSKWLEGGFEVVKGKAISSLIIALFMIHPNLTQFMFDVFNCYRIDEELRMKNDLQIVCYKDYHLFWALSTALPSIIIWGLGIPAFAFLMLQAEKDKLHKMEAKEK